MEAENFPPSLSWTKLTAPFRSKHFFFLYDLLEFIQSNQSLTI
uniref:Uncharacterized protein n=1 Tax=Lepeophtheirus salmonis TaxID=72036 RepID=A0A0K2TL13_LEPSM